MTTLYQKAENLWQTLNAIAMLSNSGKALKESDILVIKQVLKDCNPSEHEHEKNSIEDAKGN